MVEITSSQSSPEPFESTSSAYQWMRIFPVPELSQVADVSAVRSSVYPAGAAVGVSSLDVFMIEITSSKSSAEPFESNSSA